MENPADSTESARERRGTTGPFPEAFLAALPVLACFFGGSTHKWGEGIIFALLGIFLVARPPRYSLGLPINLTLVTLLLLPAIGFLPAAWFYKPACRAAFTDDFAMS